MSYYIGGDTKVYPIDEEEVEGDWRLITTETYPPLTFGVEIEFAVATLDPYDQNLQPEDNRVTYFLDANGHRDIWTPENIYSHIAASLTHAGIPAVADEPTDSTWAPEHPSLWVVKKDYSILAKSTSWGIEVASPVLTFNAESLRLVERVHEVLSGKYGIEVNNSTGLHVHVGNHDLGFDFPSMQRLAGILWTFDAQISTIHSKYRRERSQYCADFRNRSVLRTMLDKELPGLEPKVREKSLAKSLALRGIHNIFHTTTSTLKLRELMAPCYSALALDGRGSYFIGNVDNTLNSEIIQYKPTVEFRQHVSTFDSKRVHHWIGLCVRLVSVACNTDRSRLISFLKANMQKSVKEFPLGSILKEFGMNEEAAFYELQVPIDELERQKEQSRRRKTGEQEDDILFATR